MFAKKIDWEKAAQSVYKSIIRITSDERQRIYKEDFEELKSEFPLALKGVNQQVYVHTLIAATINCYEIGFSLYMFKQLGANSHILDQQTMLSDVYKLMDGVDAYLPLKNEIASATATAYSQDKDPARLMALYMLTNMLDATDGFETSNPDEYNLQTKGLIDYLTEQNQTLIDQLVSQFASMKIVHR